MKISYKLISLIIIMLGSVSCEKFLEEEIISGITDDSHYTTASGWEDGVKAVYNSLRDWYGKEPGHNMTVFGTDLFLPGINRNWAGINDYFGQLNLGHHGFGGSFGYSTVIILGFRQVIDRKL